MKSIRRNDKAIGIALIVLTLMTALPYQTALAAMIDTETALGSTSGSGMRDKLNDFMAREDVRAIFISQGISPQEAQARVDSLSDAEVSQIVNHVEQLPTGGDALGAIIGILIIVLLVLLIIRVAR